jgi:protein-disulfide isomerase
LLRTRFHEALRGWRQDAIAREEWASMLAQGARIDRHGVGARVVAAEFADYECPFCREVSTRLDSMLEAHDSIGMVFLQYPLERHPAARDAARASVCAQAAGRFPEFHRRLFTTELWRQDRNWSREAVAAGIRDTAEFMRCVESPGTAARVAADIELARRLELGGTPAFVTPSGVYEGSGVKLRRLRGE